MSGRPLPLPPVAGAGRESVCALGVGRVGATMTRYAAPLTDEEAEKGTKVCVVKGCRSSTLTLKRPPLLGPA